MLNLLSSHGLTSQNNQPTRTGINRNGLQIESCLDHVYERYAGRLSIELYDTAITDHKALLLTASLHPANFTMPSANKSPETRTVTFLNRVKLDKLLEIKNWDGLDFTTVDTAFESFINILNELKEKAKEERKIRITNNSKNRKRAPWLSHESLQLTLFKKDIYKAMNKQKGKDQAYDELLSKFKSVSAEVVKSIRKDKQIYYNNKLNHCTSSKDYW